MQKKNRAYYLIYRYIQPKTFSAYDDSKKKKKLYYIGRGIRDRDYMPRAVILLGDCLIFGYGRVCVEKKNCFYVQKHVYNMRMFVKYINL